MMYDQEYRQDYRNSDPMTSRQGATNKPRLQAIALEMISKHSPEGITAGELGIQSGLPLWKRLSELERQGKIKKNGAALFKPTGKFQTKWVTTVKCDNYTVVEVERNFGYQITFFENKNKYRR